MYAHYRSPEQRGQQVTSADDVAVLVPRKSVVGVILAEPVAVFVVQGAYGTTYYDLTEFVAVPVA